MKKKIRSKDSKLIDSNLGSISNICIDEHLPMLYMPTFLMGHLVLVHMLSWAFSLVNGFEEAIYLKSAIICNLLNILPKRIPIPAIIENKNLHSVIYSPKLINEKHLRIGIANIKEMLSEGEKWKITCKPTLFLIADDLTKKGAVCECLFSMISAGKYHEWKYSNITKSLLFPHYSKYYFSTQIFCFLISHLHLHFNWQIKTHIQIKRRK